MTDGSEALGFYHDFVEAGHYQLGLAYYYLYVSYFSYYYQDAGYPALAMYTFYTWQALGYYHLYQWQGNNSLAVYYYTFYVGLADSYYAYYTSLGYQ